MDYNEYRNEYQKVILKESLRRGVSIKQRLMDTIRNSDRQDLLELFIQTNDFEGKITSDELMLADLGDDEEFKELIENDIETTKELKKTAEDRLRELKEQNKDKENDDSEKDKDNKQGQEQENEDEEYDEHSGKAHNSEQDSSLVNNDMEDYQDLQFVYMPRNRFQTYDSQEYYVSNIKFNVMRTINSLNRIKMNVDMCPSPMMLAYLSGDKELFDSMQDLGRNIQTMPGCDEQLRMLATEQMKVAQEVKDTVDKYIQQYQQRAQEDSKNKDEGTTSLEEMEQTLQQEDEVKGKENEQQNDELGQGDESTPSKSWELPPKQKEAIQISTQQVAKDYMERQANPQPQIEENVVENSDVSR